MPFTEEWVNFMGLNSFSLNLAGNMPFTEEWVNFMGLNSFSLNLAGI
jgi:hypothetical protein